MHVATNRPTLQQEERLWQQGYRHIAGVDEAGRGAWAGPVVAAAVIVPPQSEYQGIWSQVADSKLLSPTVRTGLVHAIQATALAWGIGSASAQVIDQIGIAAATRQAMSQALAALPLPADYLLLDWVKLATVPLPQESFVKADQHIVSVAAASILAKVHRDQWLVHLQEDYPNYGFAQHKGYGTAQHLAALQQHGPCREHRHTFRPVAQAALPLDRPAR
ncbi:MAG: ribonuclease HII [Caldilineaceae bacterium]|nr:ribonuclease HII [Caldilineaceae bacterium]